MMVSALIAHGHGQSDLCTQLRVPYLNTVRRYTPLASRPRSPVEMSLAAVALAKPDGLLNAQSPGLHNFRRLRVRFERLAFIHEAFMKTACCIICWRQLQLFIVLVPLRIESSNRFERRAGRGGRARKQVPLPTLPLHWCAR